MAEWASIMGGLWGGYGVAVGELPRIGAGSAMTTIFRNEGQKFVGLRILYYFCSIFSRSGQMIGRILH